MRTAARSLQRFEPGVIEDLIPLISSKNEYQRIYATVALESLSQKSIPRLIELLGHHDEKVATAATVGLRGMSFRGIHSDAVPALAEAIRTGNDQVIRQAASALWWIGPGAKQVLPILYDQIARGERSDASRLAITRAAVKIDPEAARESKEILSIIPLLIRMLETGDFEQQGWAAETLADIGPLPGRHCQRSPKSGGCLAPRVENMLAITCRVKLSGRLQRSMSRNLATNRPWLRGLLLYLVLSSYSSVPRRIKAAMLK
jgi:HEAT repeat protein